MTDLHIFNPGHHSWQMYTKKITSISGDDLTLIPYDGKNLILEVSGNNEIIFKKGDTSYNLADLSNVASGSSLPSQSNNSGKLLTTDGTNTSWTNDISFDNVTIQSLDISNLLMNGRIDFFQNNAQIAASDPSGILNKIDNLLISNNDASINNLDVSNNITANKFIGDGSFNTLNATDASINNLDVSGNLTVGGTVTSSSPYYLRMGYDIAEGFAMDHTMTSSNAFVLPWVKETNGFRGTSTTGVPAGDTPGGGVYTWKPSITGHYMVTARCGLRGGSSQIVKYYLSMQRNYLDSNGTTDLSSDWFYYVRQGANQWSEGRSHTEYAVISTIVQVSDTKYSYRFVAELDMYNNSTSTTGHPSVIKDVGVTGVEIYKFV